jgi:hypothetical protein
MCCLLRGLAERAHRESQEDAKSRAICLGLAKDILDIYCLPMPTCTNQESSPPLQAAPDLSGSSNMPLNGPFRS